MAGTIDNALDLYGNALRGTASQRAAFLSTAVDGMLWQDTDGIRMIWRKDGALWVPAVWRWRGTTAQMNSFGANAPDGFEWFSTTDNSEYVRSSGVWDLTEQGGVFAFSTTQVGTASGWIWTNPIHVTFPKAFSRAPEVLVLNFVNNSFIMFEQVVSKTATGFSFRLSRLGATIPTTGNLDWKALF